MSEINVTLSLHTLNSLMITLAATYFLVCHLNWLAAITIVTIQHVISLIIICSSVMFANSNIAGVIYAL